MNIVDAELQTTPLLQAMLEEHAETAEAILRSSSVDVNAASEVRPHQVAPPFLSLLTRALAGWSHTLDDVL